MKMKSKTISLLLAVMMTIGLMLFAGCEPNVRNEGMGSGTTALNTTARNNGTSSTATTTHTTTHERERNNERDREGHLNEPAVGGGTSTAFLINNRQLTTDYYINLQLSAHNNKIGWGLGKHTDSRNRPTDALAAQEKYGNMGAFFIDGDTPNRIYLTFDEGYENGYTAEILDVLHKKGIKATFFVTYDYCKERPELITRMISEGHEVGNHSYSHPSFPDISEADVRDEIMKLHDYVKNNFNYEMRLIRFPKGEFNEKVLLITQELGYTSVFWSFAYMDWDVNSQPALDAAFVKITEASHPGAVILLHAVSKTNADILGELIDFWFSQGLKPSIIN